MDDEFSLFKNQNIRAWRVLQPIDKVYDSINLSAPTQMSDNPAKIIERW